MRLSTSLPMNRGVVAGILPAVSSGILPPGWKPDDTAAKMAAATGTRRFMAPMRIQTWRSKLPSNLVGPSCGSARRRSSAALTVLRVRFVTLWSWMLSLLLAGLCLLGCASKDGGSAPPGKATSRATIVPDHAVVGKVVRVNPVARFAILSFPVGVMPALDQHLFVYRGPAKVAELKVSGPRREESIVADIMNGDCQPGDEVRDR